MGKLGVLRKTFLGLLGLLFLCGCAGSLDGSSQLNNETSNIPPTTIGPRTDTPNQRLSLTDMMQRGPVFIESIEILSREGAFEELVISIVGNLPTPCNQFAFDYSSSNTVENVIAVEVFSLRDPESLCAQMLQPFAEKMVLKVKGLPSGEYKVLVNNKEVGRIDIDN